MSEYAFEGEVIKLNTVDFFKWREMYKSLNLIEELEQMDMEFSIRKREGEQVKKWFSECYARLNGRNKIAKKNGGNYGKSQQSTLDPSDTAWANELFIGGGLNQQSIRPTERDISGVAYVIQEPAGGAGGQAPMAQGINRSRN
jgi:hypothetical protein